MEVYWPVAAFAAFILFPVVTIALVNQQRARAERQRARRHKEKIKL